MRQQLRSIAFIKDVSSLKEEIINLGQCAINRWNAAIDGIVREMQMGQFRQISDTYWVPRRLENPK